MSTLARRRIAAVASALVIACSVTLILAPRAEAGLAITQRSNGIPGKGGRADVTEQRLLIGDGKIRLSDAAAGGRSLIVRLDKVGPDGTAAPVVWELDPKLELYTETAFSYWRELREKAEKDREMGRAQALERLKGEELEKYLRSKGLRADGKRVVTIERSPWEFRDGANIQRVAVVLNGVTQVAVWQSDDKYKDYRPPQEIFQFYDRTGILPADVAQALKDAVKHFPLQIYANVDLFSAGGEIETRVVAVADWKEDPAKFEVPSTYKLVKEFPKDGHAAKKEHFCPVCGKKVDPTGVAFGPERGKFFDTQDHWLEFLQNPAGYPDKR